MITGLKIQLTGLALFFLHIQGEKKVGNFKIALKLAMCTLKYEVFISIHCLGTCDVE